MRFVFYQNILSMHQSAFLRALAETNGNKVTLVVAQKEEFGRGKQGWLQADFGKCEIVIAPSENKLFSLTEARDAIHVFTGLRSFPMVVHAFKHSCRKEGLRRMVYSEPWRADGWRGFFRYLRYRWLALQYADKVEAFLLTGRLGVESYVKAGFPKAKCHEWGYYTEIPDTTAVADVPVEHGIPRLIFIGTWDIRKNVLGLIQSLKKIALPFECLLLGDGILRPQVEVLTTGDSRFRLVGNVSNSQIGGWLSACDVLVLPSIFDGWGAVVNEALMCGTRALVSDCCGAASLIMSPEHGAVFSLSKMKAALERQISYGIQANDARKSLRQWAISHISGKIAAKLFLEICQR